MRFFIKAACAVLTIFAISVGTSFGEVKRSSARESSVDSTYLVAGLDDAAQNTDVISLMNINKEGKITLLQIPRDTYINKDGRAAKLNGYYPALMQGGTSAEDGMRGLSDLISEILSVKIDGYVALTTVALRAVIDRLGGVDINLPEAIVISDELTLGAGHNHLDADDALTLIRHRASYTRADLDRLDIQGLFYKALLDRLFAASITDAYAIYKEISSEGIVSLSLSDAIRLFGMRGVLRNSSIERYTLPGEAAPDTSGVWYYFIRRNSAAALLHNILGADSNKFDKNKILLNKSRQNFIDIYNS